MPSPREDFRDWLSRHPDCCALRGALDGVRPEKPITVSEWADRYRFLSPSAAAEGGQWRTSRTPYLREIMDSLSSRSPVEEVVFMAGAQVGKTETLNNWVGYVIDHAPAPMMLVAITQPMAEKNSKTRIDPLIQETPRLRDKVSPPRARDGGNSVRLKQFQGGLLTMVGANSPADLRSMPIRFLGLDELDGYPGDVGGEGDPGELAMARTRTFRNRKIYKSSTPTTDGQSRIKGAWEAGDQRLFFVPCPHCEHYQALTSPDGKLFKHLVWEKGKPETAHYACQGCGALIAEHHKPWMLERGEWRPQNPDAPPNRRSYALSSLYSPWFTWAEIARDWEAAQGSVAKLKAFVNTILGETWKETGDSPPWKRIYNRREPYEIGKVPKGGLMITGGGDVQKDRIEVEIRAWGRNHESWSIEHLVFEGDTASDEPWLALAGILTQTWETESGARLPLARLAIDAGYQTTTVQLWARGREQVMCVKGVTGPRVPILGIAFREDISRSGKKKLRRGARSWPVGVDSAKVELYGWLRQEQPTHPEQGYPHGWIHFPEYPEEYFLQLTAEKLITEVDKRGYEKRVWVKKRERNEALDLAVYNRAAAVREGIDRWEEEEWRRLELAVLGANGEAAIVLPEKATKRRRKPESERKWRRGRRNSW